MNITVTLKADDALLSAISGLLASLQVAASAPAATPTPTPAAPPVTAPTAHTHDSIRALLNEKNTDRPIALKLKALLKTFGVEAASDLQPAQFDDFVKAVEQVK